MQNYVQKQGEMNRHRGRKISSDRGVLVSRNSAFNDYHEDCGDSQSVYKYLSESGDYEDSGISDLEMNNFNNNCSKTENDASISYTRAKQKVNRKHDKNRHESHQNYKNEKQQGTSQAQVSEVELTPNDYDIPRFRRPVPCPVQNVSKVVSESNPLTVPPKPKPRYNEQNNLKERPRSKSVNNLDVPVFIPSPKPRKTSYDSGEREGRPTSQREQVLIDVSRGRRVSDIVEAINRSRSPSPSPSTRSSEINGNDNWVLKRSPNLDVSPSDVHFRPIKKDRRMGRQEHGDVDLGSDDSIQLRKRQLMEVQENEFQTIHRDEHLNQSPPRQISNNEKPVFHYQDQEYKEYEERKLSITEEWVEKVNIQTEIDLKPTLSPEDDQELDFYRKSSTAGTAISRETVSSATNFHLTVAPQDDEPEEDKPKDTCSNFYIIVTKWVVTFLVAVTVLGCVTLNKICLLVIGREYSMPKDSNSLEKKGRKESIFIMLTIILMVPQALSLVAAIWSKRKSQPWPCKTSVLWIVLGGTIEACCLSFLCVHAVTDLSKHPHIFLLFMSGLFLIPTIIQVYESSLKMSTTNEKRRTALFALAAIFQIGGLTTLFFMEGLSHMRDKIGIPLAIVLLSAVWSPKLRRLQTKSSIPRTSNPLESPNRSTATSEQFDFRWNLDDMSTVSTRNEIDKTTEKRSAREKAALVMSLVKLVATPLASSIFCHIFKFAQLDKYADGFNYITTDHPVFYYFLVQIFATFFGYHFAWLACSMYTQRAAFALPLTLTTPLAMVFIEVTSLCNTSLAPLACGPQKGLDLYLLIGAGGLLHLGQFLSTGYYVWTNKGYIMGKASHLFWLPSYTGALLEPFLLLNRRNKVTDDSHVTSKQLTRKSYVFICSTMYHEELYEMEQLLESIHDIDNNIQRAKRHVESHIFFDGAIKSEVMNEYVLQLATIVRKTLKVELNKARKIRTPYGMQLQWVLPGGLPMTIHMKDNSKVKNKKRWSQVMYMSYVLDYKQRLLQVNDDQSFILTTDADVHFTHDSVEALIDYMVQDEKIGAVCGRTHPMGNGPLVWYQTFDYAVGHWFMKVANHVFGSVLCCPGCFSLYRCKAVRSVLREYSSNVNEAFEFLTKDMGEDRWFCTLMVENGWRLAYCAAAEDKTYCPQEFEEFYKQRRRWMPSTLANLSLLVSKWRMVLANNENISFPFILFQIFLLLATLIGPSIVILFIVGGLVSLSSANEEVVVILFSILTIVYSLICLFFSQDIQIKVAKFLTFVFSIIMILVTIGLCTQIEKEVSDRKKLNITEETPFVQRLPASVSTLYLGFLVAIFFVTALLHPREFMSLLHGFWYLLCLPSGYLLLTIYSIINMTDRSWGTREGKNANAAIGQNENPFVTLWNLFKSKCSCCFTCCQQSSKNESTGPRPSKKLSRSQWSSKFRDRIRGIDRHRNRHHRHRAQDLDTDSEYSEAASSIHSTQGRQHAVNRAAKRKNKNHGTLNKLISVLRSEQHFDRESDVNNSVRLAKSSRTKPQRKKEVSQGTLRRIKELFPNISPVLNHDVEIQRRESGDSNKSIGKPAIPITVAVNAPIDYEDEVPPSEMFGALGNRGFVPDDDQRVTAMRRLLKEKTHQTDSLGGSSDSAYNSDASLFPRGRNGRSIEPLNSLDVPKRNISALSNRDDDEISHTTMDDLLTLDISLEMSVDEWLKGDLRPYVDNFKLHGYDTLAFITGMSQQDLEVIGVTVSGHRNKLHRAIKNLPPLIIEEGIPADVRLWLDDLNLGEYWQTFVENGCTESTDLEDLKKMSKDNLKAEYKVTKIAHMNMLYKAIQKLKYANRGQKQISAARRELERLPTETLEPINEFDTATEYAFWESLKQQCLLPESAVFTDNAELKQKLADLRNSVVMIFFVANALWMVVIMVLVKQTRLKTLGVDILGLSFLLLYGFITFFQFLAMIFHRLTTLLHILARTPWICCGQQQNINYRDNMTITPIRES